MTRKRTLLLIFSMLVLMLSGMASTARADEIVVDIPEPTTVTKLPSGASYARLTPEDIEYAKSQVREAYQKAKSEGVEKPIVAQLPGVIFQLTEPIVLGPEDSGDAERPIIWRGESGGGTDRFQCRGISDGLERS